jgi:hypothetical protein
LDEAAVGVGSACHAREGGHPVHSGLGDLMIEIAPIRIGFLNQSDLPSPVPFFHLLFARNRCFDIGMRFEIDKLCDIVSLRESLYEFFSVFIHAANQIVGDTDI